MKKGVAVLLCLMLLVSANVVTYAKSSQAEGLIPVSGDVAVITPFWTNTFQILAELSFNNGRGSLSGTVIGQPGTTNITASAVFERQNSNGTYTQVTSWTNLTAEGNILFWDTNYYVSRGYTYRLTLTATVYRNGTGETVSVSKSMYAD